MRNFIYLMLIVFTTITSHSCRKKEAEAKITINSTTSELESLETLPSEGSSKELKFDSSLDWTISTADTKSSTWLGVTPTSGGAGSATITITAPSNQTTTDRKSKISITSGTHTEKINVTQLGRVEDLELIAFYKATGGYYWTNNTNWTSNKPLDTWYGVTMSANKVTQLELSKNNLTGSVPTEIGELTKLTYLELSWNQLAGTIPSTVLKYWRNIINQGEGYGFDLTGVTLPGFKETVTDIKGSTLDFSNIYSQSKYTVFLNWSPNDASSTTLINKLVPAFQQKHSEGLEIIAYTANNADDRIEENGMSSWKNFNSIDNPNAPSWTGNYPMAEVIDQTGQVVFSYIDYNKTDSRLGKSVSNDLIPFIEDKFGKIDFTANYESTDYSKDGKVLTMQTATSGAGINLVIVGDAFSDKDMGTNGKYEQRMREAMEHFFSEEPYKSYRNRYNVYTVKAISKNEVYNTGSQTIFECNFGNGTLIEGNDSKVFEYALRVPSISNTSDLTVISILNTPIYAGTCYMYTNNASIAYCPIVYYKDESYRQIITHEAGGHGFAKLADEYFYSGTIPAELKSQYQTYKDKGWIANVDITSDPNTIRWAHMLSDGRYIGEVGIYEGGLTYQYGVYRPTESSIMRGNTGGFNAPSREAIFKRIMTLSGSTYQYEDFVSYDAINRTTSAMAARSAQTAKVDISTFIPLAPPVIIWDSPKIRK